MHNFKLGQTVFDSRHRTVAVIYNFDSEYTEVLCHGNFMLVPTSMLSVPKFNIGDYVETAPFLRTETIQFGTVTKIASYKIYEIYVPGTQCFYRWHESNLQLGKNSTVLPQHYEYEIHKSNIPNDLVRAHQNALLARKIETLKGIQVQAKVPQLTIQVQDMSGDDICADVTTQQTYWSKK